MTEVEKEALRGLALRRLREMIANCQLAPGAWVTEKQLSDATGLGLTPVRSAMTTLRHDGFLIATPRVGYRVAPMTLADVADLFDVWAVVGRAIIERAVERATPEEVAEFQRAHDREAWAEHFPSGDADVTDWTYGIFSSIVGMAHSQRLTAIYDRYSVDLSRVLVIANRAGTEMGEALRAQDGNLLRSMRERNPQWAIEGFDIVTETVRRLALGVLQSAPGIADAPLRLS
ncbi:GntR family transcriptional regulator [Nonomuraea sp. NPDC050783]|uniref:GntR family transcriptional regulator n=1 Tax=Nonomuraea sp. NPDC050783 TaxID=3154634 RepID=UPI003467E769